MVYSRSVSDVEECKKNLENEDPKLYDIMVKNIKKAAESGHEEIPTLDECKKKLEKEDPELYDNMVKNIKKAAERGHEAILLYLNEINFGIGDFVQKNKSKGKRVTVFRIILENVSNGHDLILQILHSLVKKVPKDECSKCFDTKKDAKIEIDLESMFKHSMDPTEISRSKSRLIRDLLDIQSKRGDDNNVIKIFQHPVIEILILKKWEHHQVVYVGIVRFFALIVFLFTFFVRLRLLEEDEKRCINISNFTKTPELADCDHYLKNGSNWNSGWLMNNTETTPPFNHTIPQLLIFKYKETSFVIFAVGMFFVVMYQLFCFSWVLLEAWKQCFNCKKNQENCKKHQEPGINCNCSKRQKERMIQTIKIRLANLFYILFAISLVCLHSPIPTLKCCLLLFWVWILLAEIHQVCFLVIRPAWQGFNFMFLKRILQHRYFKDPENYLELFCLVSIPLALYSDAWARYPRDEREYDENDWSLKDEAIFRGVIAIGVFAAWTELFIKLGNVATSVVGDFTKMFYNIIKSKLLAYMQVCILLILAFSLAFWIILEGHLKKDGVDFSKGFWVNLVLTVTMSTGEFNTGEFYENIGDNEVIKVFAMLFLIGLVILSTITMINLLVAAIISDYEKMKVSVDMENLFFITEYILEAGEQEKILFKMCEKIPKIQKLYDFLVTEDAEMSIKYCPHLICNSDVCDITPLPIAKPGWSYNQAMEAGEREPLLLRLLEIRQGMERFKKDDDEENLCSYHKYGALFMHSVYTVDRYKRTPLKMKTNGRIATAPAL